MRYRNSYNEIVEGGSTHNKGLRLFTPKMTEANRDYNESTRNLSLSRSRNLYNSNSVASAAVSRLQENVIGLGLKPRSKIDNKILGLSNEEVKDLQNQFENDFCFWAKSRESDFQMQTNFNTCTFVAFTTYLLSGEVFTNIAYRERGGIYNTCCQLVEPERVSNPQNTADSEFLRQGIQLGKDKENLGYWITAAHPQDEIWFNNALEWNYYPIKGKHTNRTKTFQVIKPKRIGQLRGIGIFAPVMNELKQVSRANENELIALVLQGMLTFFSYTTESSEQNIFSSEETENAKTSGVIRENEILLGNGSLVELPEGRKIEMANPTRPNSTYDKFIDFMCMWIGASLGIPSEVLSLKFNSSYTAARAAFIQVAQVYENYAGFFGENFCQHYYGAIIDENVATGKYKLKNYSNPVYRAAYCNAIWKTEGLQHIDEVKQATAASIRVQNKITSLKYEREKMGVDHDLIEQQLDDQIKKYPSGTGGTVNVNFHDNKQDNE